MLREEWNIFLEKLKIAVYKVFVDLKVEDLRKKYTHDLLLIVVRVARISIDDAKMVITGEMISKLGSLKKAFGRDLKKIHKQLQEVHSQVKVIPEPQEVEHGCTCGNCINMEPPLENKCCCHTNIVDGKIEDGMQSIKDHEAFVVNCLNRHVLETSYYEYLEENGPLEENELIHKNEMDRQKDDEANGKKYEGFTMCRSFSTKEAKVITDNRELKEMSCLLKS